MRKRIFSPDFEMSEFGPDLSLVAAIAAPKERGVLISVGNVLLGPEFVKQIEDHRGDASFEIVEFPNEEYHAGTLSKTLFREVFRGTRVECLSANGDETVSYTHLTLPTTPYV